MADFKLKTESQKHIAYTFNKGKQKLCLLYLHGWTASRNRKKGFKIAEIAQREGCHYLSLDYMGHGDSDGTLADFTVGQGIQDTLAVIQKTIKKMPLIIVGNSIGGWIGLWLAQQLKTVVGLVGLAPAPDITEYVWDKLMPDYAKAEILKGNIIGPSAETFGFCFTPQFFQDGRKHLMLNTDISFTGPVRLFLGDQDDRVDRTRVDQIKDRLTSSDVVITYIKGADHHLSDELSLNQLDITLTTLIKDFKCRK